MNDKICTDLSETKTDPHYVTIEKGKEILKDLKKQLTRFSEKKYPNLYYYLGKGKPIRQELLDLLTFLINPHNKLNEGGEIEQRFFTAFHRYCFYVDTDAYTHKIRKRGEGRQRSNRALNLFCALGLFDKDIVPDNYKINLNMKLNTGRKRDLNIYHFRRITLEELEENAKRLRAADITLSSLSAVNLRAKGLNDIADIVYFKNRKDAYDKKYREFLIVLDVLEDLIEEKGYCTRGQLINALPFTEKESEKVIRAFKQDIEVNYRYAAPKKEDREKYNYQATKWIYTRKEQQ